MEHSLLPFRTGSQYVLESRKQLPRLRRLFGPSHRGDFYGVKLNLPDSGLIKLEELKSLLNGHQMKTNMLATGVYVRTHGLSLSSGVLGERIRTISGCKRSIDYAASMGYGIIIGFLKGDPGSDHEVSERLFLGSMLELESYIEEKRVQVLTEATDHKEASIIRTLKKGAHVIGFPSCPFVQPLADTYHMNIEEPSLVDSLSEYMNYYPHLHISDDNRTYLGLSSLNFTVIYRKLTECEYKGTVAVEGSIQHDLLEDTQICTIYLHKMCSGLYILSRVSSYAV